MNLRPAVLACVVFVIGWVSRLPAQEPAKELAWKYHEPFQGTPRQAKDFVLFGADAARLVKYEADGLRIALPAGKSHRPTGVVTMFGLSGDFDVSANYEILQEPEQADAGTRSAGTRISLTVKLDETSEAAIRRKVTPEVPVHILAWRVMLQDAKRLPQGEIFPVTQKKGRLRMVRKGTEVTYYQSEGDDKEFKALTTIPFVADDVQAVQLFGETSSPKAALEVRFTDLHIAAIALATTVKRPVEPAPKTAAPAIPAMVFMPAHRPEALGALFSPDGKWLITTGADRRIAIRDPATGNIRRVLQGHTNRVYRAVVSADSKTLVTVSSDGTVRIWSIERGEQTAMFNAGQDKLAAARAVALSPSGDLVASGADDGTIKLWSMKDQKELQQLEVQALPVTSLAFSPDGAVLVSSSGDWRNYNLPGEVRLWEVASGKPLGSLPGYTTEVKKVAIDPTGRYLATAGSSRVVRLWDFARRAEIGKINLDSAGTALEFSADGARLAVGENFGGISVWYVPAATLATRYAGHAKSVSGITFSPDGKRLAAAGHDGIISMWPASDDPASSAK
jgi:hypothetical protein